MNKLLQQLQSLGFETHKTTKEVLIVNPSDPDRGTAILNPSDNFLAWARTEFTYWGPFASLDDDQEAQLVAHTIVEFLGAVSQSAEN